MDKKMEGTISIIAALLVLFSTMIDPIISAGLAVGFLTTWGFYKILKK